MVTKTFPGNFKSLELISKFIVKQAQKAGFNPDDVYAIQTAVDEACSNIIDHAYRGEDLGTIIIKVNEKENSLHIVLRDKGKPFDPNDVPQPNINSSLENRKERGLGIFFMRNLMDQVIFEFSEEKGNKLTLVKNKRS
ncbi:MAG: ATP-binding protein [Chloroflexota bacterium]|nr:ATP-binding protein [Chloroflexota bacterium]